MALVVVFLTNRSNTARLRIQFEHEHSEKNKELRRQRGEELYELSDKWLNRLAAYYLQRISVMQGKLTFNECLDLEIAAGKENAVNFGRIEMLVDVYFSSTRRAYDDLISARSKLNEIAIAHKRAYQRGEIYCTAFLSSFVEAQKMVENAGGQFRADIINCIRAL